MILRDDEVEEVPVCPTCDGYGEVEVEDDDTGAVDMEECEECSGTGYLQEEK